jgi:hypothetical protein
VSERLHVDIDDTSEVASTREAWGPSWPFTCPTCGGLDMYPAPLDQHECLTCNPAIRRLLSL